MRANGQLFYLHSDPLGSASLMPNQAGSAVSETPSRRNDLRRAYWTSRTG